MPDLVLKNPPHRNLLLLLSLLLGAAVLHLLSAEWAIAEGVKGHFPHRFLFAPRTFIFFSSIVLVDRYPRLRLLLTGLLVLLCSIQFRVVERPHLAFPSFMHYALYREVSIPLPVFVDRYPESWFITLSHPPLAHVQLLEHSFPLQEVSGEGGAVSYQGQGVRLVTEKGSPAFTFTVEAPPETEDLFFKVKLNRSAEGWVRFSWSSDSSFSVERTTKRWYPSGAIAAEFACPCKEKKCFLRIESLEAGGEVTLREIRVIPIPHCRERVRNAG